MPGADRAFKFAAAPARLVRIGRRALGVERRAWGAKHRSAVCHKTAIDRPYGRCQCLLLKRVFDIDMHTCPNCGGGELKIIAAILERPVIEKILTDLGLDPQPPPRGRAREAVQD